MATTSIWRVLRSTKRAAPAEQTKERWPPSPLVRSSLPNHRP